MGEASAEKLSPGGCSLGDGMIGRLQFPNMPSAHSFVLVMEYLSGGEIKWRNEQEKPVLRVDQCRRICRDVILGLEYRKSIY